MEKDWVNVYTTDKEHLAQIAKMVLADHNIECVILNQRDSSYGSFGDIEVWVHTNYSVEAENLLKEL